MPAATRFISSDILESNFTENAGVMKKPRHDTICMGKLDNYRANRTALKVCIRKHFYFKALSTKLRGVVYLRAPAPVATFSLE